MIVQLLLSNLYYFSVTILSSFAFFATGLLYLDAWQVSKKHFSPLLRAIGFMIIALVGLSVFLLTTEKLLLFTAVAMTLGVACIFVSLIIEPVLKKPGTKFAAFIPVLPAFHFLSLALLAGISGAYFVKARRGLERQLWPAGLAFVFIFLSQVIVHAQKFLTTDNIVLLRLFETFGIMWHVQLTFLLIGSIILGVWAWGYIRFRLLLQIFISTLLITLLIFIATTSFFSFFLLKNIEREALAALETNGKVFQYTLERLQLEALNNAKTVTTDQKIVDAFSKNNTADLAQRAQEFMVSQRASTLVLTDTDGLVSLRAEDVEKSTGNLSNNPFVVSALRGQDLAGIFVEDGVITPTFYVGAASALKNGPARDRIAGSVLTGFLIDNGFLDGVKSLTGLDVALYAGDTRSATTLLAPDGISRYVGSKESNPAVVDTVLGKGEAYLGANTILNQPYYATYLPLRQNGGEVIGMLFAGQPQIQLQTTAQKAVDSTFLTSGILILASLLPVYLYARYIKENVEV